MVLLKHHLRFFTSHRHQNYYLPDSLDAFCVSAQILSKIAIPYVKGTPSRIKVYLARYSAIVITLSVYPALIQQNFQFSFGGITVELIFYTGGQI